MTVCRAVRWGRGAVERVVQGHLPPERRAVVELVLHVQVCPYDVYVRMPACMHPDGYCGPYCSGGAATCTLYFTITSLLHHYLFNACYLTLKHTLSAHQSNTRVLTHYPDPRGASDVLGICTKRHVVHHGAERC